MLGAAEQLTTYSTRCQKCPPLRYLWRHNVIYFSAIAVLACKMDNNYNALVMYVASS